MPNTFLTRSYKQGWIHTCYVQSISGEVVSVTLPDHSSREVKSVRAAKITITRHISSKT